MNNQNKTETNSDPENKLMVTNGRVGGWTKKVKETKKYKLPVIKQVTRMQYAA